MWSTMPTISKLLLNDMDNYKVLSISSLFAMIAMLIINFASGKWKIMKSYKIKDYLIMAAIGFPGVFLYYAFYYAGANLMLASQAFIVNYLWPIMSIVFASIILKEKMTVRKVIALIMSFLGVFTVAGGDILSFNENTIQGTVFCFLCAVCYGLYTALNKKANYDKQVSMTVAMFAAFLPSTVILLIRGGDFCIEAAQIPGLLWNGVATIALANLFWALALAKGSTAKISNLAYITPFLSLVWTFFVLKEKIEPISNLGLSIIVAGIFIQLKDNKNVKKA